MKMSIINDTTFGTSKNAVKNNVFIKINIDTIKYSVSLFDKVYIIEKTFVGLVLLAMGAIRWILLNKDTHSYILRMKANLESAHPFQETFEVDLVNYGHMELKK